MEHPPIRKQTSERTCELIEANPRILPHGMLDYVWKALDNTCSNVKEVGKTHEFYAGLKRGKLGSLSISSLGEEPEEADWGFTVYAVDSSDFLAQFSHNVAIALKHGIDSIACTYETMFEKALDEIGPKSEEDHRTHLVLLEKRCAPGNRRVRQSTGDFGQALSAFYR